MPICGVAKNKKGRARKLPLPICLLELETFPAIRTTEARLLLRASSLRRGVRVLLGEPLDAPCRIDELLLTREKRVAVRANFDLQHVALDGRPRRELVAARAVHGDGVIIGVNIGLHGVTPV